MTPLDPAKPKDFMYKSQVPGPRVPSENQEPLSLLTWDLEFGTYTDFGLTFFQPFGGRLRLKLLKERVLLRGMNPLSARNYQFLVGVA